MGLISFTVTLHLAYLPLAVRATMVALPLARPEIQPFWSTLHTALLEESQVMPASTASAGNTVAFSWIALFSASVSFDFTFSLTALTYLMSVTTTWQ